LDKITPELRETFLKFPEVYEFNAGEAGCGKLRTAFAKCTI
jgi:hypothetical protein